MRNRCREFGEVGAAVKIVRGMFMLKIALSPEYFPSFRR